MPARKLVGGLGQNPGHSTSGCNKSISTPVQNALAPAVRLLPFHISHLIRAPRRSVLLKQSEAKQLVGSAKPRSSGRFAMHILDLNENQTGPSSPCDGLILRLTSWHRARVH